MTEPIQTLLDEARRARNEGRAIESRNAYARAASLSREAGAPLLQAHALRHLSDIDREAGRDDEALAHADQAIALYRATPGAESLDLANALRLAALALDALRRPQAAAGRWDEARALYRAAGVEAGVAECEGRLTA